VAAAVRPGLTRGDLIAGAVVAALAVPQALGYASIAGAPVQVGLYAVPLALVAYAIFGSSRQLVVGPVSTVSVLSGRSWPASGWPGPRRRPRTRPHWRWPAGWSCSPPASSASAGWPSSCQADRDRFVLGLVILVILGELPHLLGVPTPQGQVVERVGALGSLGRGDADATTVVISAVALLVLFGGQWLARSVPWALVVLIAGLAVSNALDPRRARRRGGRPGAARAADARGAVGGRRRHPGAAQLGGGAGPGGAGRGAERGPAVRQPRRLPDRR
jgi:hypothetical protein